MTLLKYNEVFYLVGILEIIVIYNKHIWLLNYTLQNISYLF